MPAGLACVDIGTATGPMYAAQAQGKKFHVFCDEPVAFHRAQPSPRGNSRSKNFPSNHCDNAAAGPHL